MPLHKFKMVLEGLEFEECFLDSPEFRQNLRIHEAEIEKTDKGIRDLIRTGKTLVEAAQNLSRAQRAFSQMLTNFKFECVEQKGNEEEVQISTSLQELGKLVGLIEDERDRMLEAANYDKLANKLEDFRRDHIAIAREHKKSFDKQTERYCKSVDSHVKLTPKKNSDAELHSADLSLDSERRQYHRESLSYVYKLQEVQERKKFDFVENLVGFANNWLLFYTKGHEVSTNFKPYMTNLQLKLQSAKSEYEQKKKEADGVMHKMLMAPYDSKKQEGLHEGYLYVQFKRSWTKCYCTFNKNTKVLKMSMYSQTLPAVTGEQFFTVTSCTRKVEEINDRRFCFDITVTEKHSIVVIQAINKEERTQWMVAMGCKDPA